MSLLILQPLLWSLTSFCVSAKLTPLSCQDDSRSLDVIEDPCHAARNSPHPHRGPLGEGRRDQAITPTLQLSPPTLQLGALTLKPDLPAPQLGPYPAAVSQAQ